MQIPILTYHAMNVSGNSYESNDHVAFAADLDLFRYVETADEALAVMDAWD